MLFRYTVPSDVSQVLYAGDGTTQIFSIPFVFFETSDIEAVLTTDATGAETTLVLNTDFTVSGGEGETGSATVLTAPASGKTLTLTRSIPYTQEIDFEANDPFPAEVAEEGFDRNTMLAQQTLLLTKKSPKLPATYDPDTDGTIRLPMPEAGKVLVGNDDGTGWEGAAIAELGNLPATIVTPLDHDLLEYDAAASTWRNQSFVRNADAVSRSLRSWLTDQAINVKDFGAVGNGTTDDTAAIQAAIDAAESQNTSYNTYGPGIKVWFPTGRYLVSDTLTIEDHSISLEGEGSSQSLIYRKTDYGDTVLISPADIATASNQAGNHVKNLGFFHDTVQATSGAHLHYVSCTRVDINGVVLGGLFGGLKVESSNAMNIDNIGIYFDYDFWTVEQLDSYGMLFAEATGLNPSLYAPSAEIAVSNFNIKGGNKASGDFFGGQAVWVTSGDGIWFANGHCGFAVTGSVVIQPSGSGITVQSITFANVYADGSFKGGNGLVVNTPNGGSVRAILWDGGILANHTSYGAYIDPGASAGGVAINGAWIAENGLNGINLVSGTNYRVTNNTIRNNGGPQLSVFAVSDVSVTGNFIGAVSPAAVQTGISFGASDRVVVSGNTFASNTSGADLSGTSNLGSNCEISGNTTDQSKSVASAATLPVPPIGHYFTVTGTTGISAIAAAPTGRIITLQFSASLTVSASGTLFLAGSTFAASNGSTLTLISIGSGAWNEIARRT